MNLLLKMALKRPVFGDPRKSSYATQDRSSGRRRHRKPTVASRVGLGLSSLLLVLTAAAYVWAPIGLSAWNVLPVWFWWYLGITAALVAWPRQRRNSLILFTLWMLLVVAVAEEPRSLARMAVPADRASAELVVGSLNCAVGVADIAGTFYGLDPDVVLLQESPGMPALKEAASLLGALEVVRGYDGSILVRGKVLEATPDAQEQRCFTRARVVLEAGQEVEIISLRMIPSPIRLDYYNPACWLEHAANRRTHMQQLQTVVQHLASVPPEVPVILGGDFNLPQHDRVVSVLRPRLRDTYHAAGRGWGNTFMSILPVLRLDRIYASSDLQVLDGRAVSSRMSDHRAVVAWLKLPGREPLQEKVNK